FEGGVPFVATAAARTRHGRPAGGSWLLAGIGPLERAACGARGHGLRSVVARHAVGLTAEVGRGVGPIQASYAGYGLSARCIWIGATLAMVSKSASTCSTVRPHASAVAATSRSTTEGPLC